MHPFLYHLKTAENRKVFWYFQGVEKGCIVKEWVKCHLRKTNITYFPLKERRRLIKLAGEREYKVGNKMTMLMLIFKS